MDRPSTSAIPSNSIAPRYLNDTASSVARLPTANSGMTRLGPITSSTTNNGNNNSGIKQQQTSIDSFSSSSSSSSSDLGAVRPRTQLVRRGGGGTGGDAPSSSINSSNAGGYSTNGGYAGMLSSSSSSSSSWSQTQKSRIYGESRGQGGAQHLSGYEDDAVGSRLVIPGLMIGSNNTNNDTGGGGGGSSYNNASVSYQGQLAGNLSRPSSFYGNVPGTANGTNGTSSRQLNSMGGRIIGGTESSTEWTNASSSNVLSDSSTIGNSNGNGGGGGGGGGYATSRNALSSRGPTRGGTGGYAELQQQQQRSAIRLSTASNTSSVSTSSDESFSNAGGGLSTRSTLQIANGQRVLPGMNNPNNSQFSDNNNSNLNGNTSSASFNSSSSRSLLSRSSVESSSSVAASGIGGPLKPISHQSLTPTSFVSNSDQGMAPSAQQHQSNNYAPPSSAYYVPGSAQGGNGSSSLGSWPFWNNGSGASSAGQIGNSSDYSSSDGQHISRGGARLGTSYGSTGGGLQQQPSISYGGNTARPLTTLPLDQSSSSLSRTLQQSRQQQLQQQQHQQQQYSVIPPATSSGVRGANSLSMAGRNGLYQGSVISGASGSVSGSFASSPYNQPVRGGFSGGGQQSSGHASPTSGGGGIMSSNSGSTVPSSRGGFGYNTGASLSMNPSSSNNNRGVSGGASLYNSSSQSMPSASSSSISANSSTSSSGISSPLSMQQQSVPQTAVASQRGSITMNSTSGTRQSAALSNSVNSNSSQQPNTSTSSSSSSAASGSSSSSSSLLSSSSFSSAPGGTSSSTSLSTPSSSSSSSSAASSQLPNKKASSTTSDSASTAIANATAAVAATAANAAMAAAMANSKGGSGNSSSQAGGANGVSGAGSNANTRNGPNGSEDVIILPHRLVTSVTQVSAVGAVSWRGRNPTVMKINQDAVVVAEHGPTNSLLVAVFDGHGVNGREVSAYFKERYPLALFTDKRFFAKLDSKKGLSRSPSPTHSKEGSTVDDDGASITSDSSPASGLYLSPQARSGKHAGGSTSPNSKKHAAGNSTGNNSNASSALCDVMADVLLSTELALIQSSGINCTLSGSTSVVVLIREGVLHIVNVGDSRGILAAAPQPTVPISSSAIAAASSAATQTGNPVPGLIPGQHLEAAEEANAQLSHPAVRIRVLTVDHKPDMPRERQRILTCGGRVLSTRVKGAPHLLGPPRVWLKNAPLPGLNMSRSLGDLIAKQAGVISTPHKAVHNISAFDRALILASDGLWDFVSNEETGSLALSTSDSWDASARLARLSRSRWLTRTGGADDTTVVVVRLGEV